MSFDLNITVNGSRCKQYQSGGKTYIEAKNGSEYVLEIKNSYWKRILAVASVDGLNVLTGKSASDKDSGYIIPAYGTEKIKGFRFSNNEWAMFKFGYKFLGNTYAQSKGDGSEKNCGVIGFRLFYEQEPIVQWTCNNTYTWNPYPPNGWTTDAVDCDTFSGPVNYSCDNLGSQNQPYATASDCLRAKSVSNSMGGSPKASSKISRKASASPAKFDMGTEWGRREQSKVNTVEFDRGCLARSVEIYYASREQLIKMGVPIHNVLSVPQAFPGAYSEPPQGWSGV